MYMGGDIMFYKKKPVIVEAIQWTGENEQQIFKWMSSHNKHDYCMANGHMIIKTLEGDHIANIGDFIIRGVHGEYYPCKPDIFQKTYEHV